MARIIGLDWGTVRTGVAMSDEEQKLAFPLQHPLESSKAAEEIKKLAQEYDVEKIVMGLPKSLSGEEGQSSKDARKFAASIQKKIDMEIEFVDERFSSVASGKALQEQRVKEKDQRQIKDNIAAALLLQQYLDKH